MTQVAEAIHADNNKKIQGKANAVMTSPDISEISEPTTPPSLRRTAKTFQHKEKLQKELGEQKRVIAQQQKLLLEETTRSKEQLTKAKMKQNKATMKTAAAKNNRKKAPPKKKKATAKKKKAPPKNDEDSDEDEDSEPAKAPPKKNEDEDDDEDSEPAISSPEPLEPEEYEELEPCSLVCHNYNKDGEIQVQVDWKNQRVRNSQMLYDMWADYPEEVLTYRKENKLSNKKAWKKPNMESIEYVVRILSMVGDNGGLRNASFCTLWNNGFKVDNTSYAELEEDASDILEKFLSSIENMSEAQAEVV